MPDTFAGFHAEERASVPVLWRRDDRFKTLRVTFQTRRPLDRRAAARSLLPALLLQGTRRSPGRPALMRRMDAMYGASVVPGVEKQSPDHVLRLGLDAVAGAFLPERPDQLGEGLAFLAEQITDPDLDGAGFREAVFERERRQAADYVRSLVDDRSTWAGIRALEVACDGEPIAIPSTGTLAEIEALRREDPEQARQDFLVAGEPLVVAAGAFDRDELMAAVDRFLDALPARTATPGADQPAWIEARPTRRVVERVVLQQSKLVGIWRLPPSDDPDLWLARRLFVSLLGGGPHSRLFREVREKRSLAYAVQAGLDRRSGLVTLRAGLDEQAAEPVVAETLRQIDELSAGRFEDVELETARSQLLGSIDSVTDSVGGLCRYVADHWLLGVDRDPETLAAAYRSIDRERVASSFEGLWLDTVYLLAPSDSAEGSGAGAIEEGGMNDPRFDVRRDPILGEEVWLATTERGVGLRVVPTDRFRESVAVVAVGYGSTDLGFSSEGAVHRSPEGVAHYLEHKLFEDEDLHVFERFGRRGARVNAMTGFTRTQYYFQGMTAFADNLADLLRLTARAHLTDDNVEKERGIIAQELRMYEDHPEYRGFFALLRRLYAEHPVRHPVGGTVDSIAGIDVAELLACHRAFYRGGNVALAAAGPIDPAQVLEAASAWDLAAGAAPERHCPEDLGPADGTPEFVPIALARPRLLIGLKERSLVDDAGERTVRELTTRILLDALFGPGSEIREDLHHRGVVDDSLSASYTSERTFGFAVLGAESDDPERVAAELRSVLSQPLELASDHLERIGRRVLGSYVRSFDSQRSLAFGHCDEGLEGLEPFGTLGRLRSITGEMVEERRRELCREDSFAQVLMRG